MLPLNNSLKRRVQCHLLALTSTTTHFGDEFSFVLLVKTVQYPKEILNISKLPPTFNM